MSTIKQTRTEVLALLDSRFVQKIVVQGIPDINTVLRNNTTGKIIPYIAIQFGDLQNAPGKSFIGPRGHDYDMPIYVQCISPDPLEALEFQDKVDDLFLGVSFDWTGNMEKRSGGAMFPMTNSNSATEAYVSASSFGLPVQFE